MRSPTVSIVIPVYNTEKYLAKCMESLLSQTLRNMEFILVDDGSTDASGALCDEYARRDERVRVFHKPNGGVSSARNLGLEHVTGRYLAFVDPDDWVELDTYERLVREIEKHCADVVFFGYDEVPENGPESDVIIHSPEKTGEGDAKEGIRQMMLGIGKGYFTLIANKLLRTDLCRDTDGQMHQFDETIAVGEDGLWLVDAIMKASKVYFDNSVLYHWLIRDNSACHIKALTSARLSAIEAQERIIGKISGYGKKTVQLAKARLYDDCFYFGILAHLNHNRMMFDEVMKRIAPYRCAFYCEKEISIVRKIKVVVCGTMIKLNASGGAVEKVFGISTYKIKRWIATRIVK